MNLSIRKKITNSVSRSIRAALRRPGDSRQEFRQLPACSSAAGISADGHAVRVVAICMYTLLITFLLTCSGCAEKVAIRWKHPEKGPQAFEEELQECNRLSEQETVNYLYTGGYNNCKAADCPPPFAGLQELRGHFLRKCLTKQFGWTVESVPEQ